ncbi:glycosyl transferase family protein [Mycobacterium tuberculosis]|nr:glycosyl transferase family protein [Mycobacterium tuberculosis]
MVQVGINYGDAVKLTHACATEQEVRRAPDAGRYVLADEMASGPAMFDTTRLDQAHRDDRLQTASLDEVLCVAAT